VVHRRLELPVGPLLCIITGRHADDGGRPRPRATRCDTPRLWRRSQRFAPRQLRHAHAVEMAHEGVPLIVIQRQLGHTDLGMRSIYLKASTTPRSSTLSTPDPHP
jgi:integrase